MDDKAMFWLMPRHGNNGKIEPAPRTARPVPRRGGPQRGGKFGRNVVREFKRQVAKSAMNSGARGC